MREIIFDTETTGLDPKTGDRMVEIGCIEMVGRVETGRSFHAYYNPERDMPPEAERVHGLSAAFLSTKPRFAQSVDELLAFLDCPRDHRVRIRTTNVIERAFREVRRRTRTMSCFQNSASVDRVIYGIINHLNTTWKEKPLPEFTH